MLSPGGGASMSRSISMVAMSAAGGTRLPFTPARSPGSGSRSGSVSASNGGGRRGSRSLMDDCGEGAEAAALCTCASPLPPAGGRSTSNVSSMPPTPTQMSSPAYSSNGAHALAPPYHAVTSPSHSFFQRSQSGAATPSSELGLGFAITPTTSNQDLGSLDPTTPSLPAAKLCPQCGKLKFPHTFADDAGAQEHTNQGVPSLLTICMDLLAENLDQVRRRDLSFLPPDQVQPLVDRLAAARELTPRKLSRFARRAVYRLYLDHGGGADWLPLVGDMPLRELSLSFCNGIASTQSLSAKKARQRADSHSAGAGGKKRFRKEDHIAANLEVFRVEACPFVGSHDLMVAAEFRNLRVLQFIDSQHVTNKVLMSLTTLKKLEELRVQGASKITTFGFQKCLSHLGNLRRLHIEQCPKVTSLVGSNVDALPKLVALTLRALRVKNAGLAPPLADLASLTELDLYDMKLEDEGLLQLSALAGLRHLCVSHTQVNDSVAQLPDFAPGLTSLYLSGCKRLEREWLRQCLSRLRELRKLKMRKVGAVNASVLMALSRAARNLTHLNISECDVQLSPEVVSQFPSLTTLICRQTDFAPAALPALATHCPELSSLDLARCSIPTDTDFLALRDLPGLTHLDLSYALFTNSDLRSPASRAMSADAVFVPQLSPSAPSPTNFSISSGLSTLNLGASASQVHAASPSLPSSKDTIPSAFGGANGNMGTTRTLAPISRGSAFSPRNSSSNSSEAQHFPHPAATSFTNAANGISAASKSAQKPRRSSKNSTSMFASGSTIFSVLATNTPTRSPRLDLPQEMDSPERELSATQAVLAGHKNEQSVHRNSNSRDTLQHASVLPRVQGAPHLKQNGSCAVTCTQESDSNKSAFSSAFVDAPSGTHHTSGNDTNNTTSPIQLKASTSTSKILRGKQDVRSSPRVAHSQRSEVPRSPSVPSNIMLPPLSEEKTCLCLGKAMEDKTAEAFAGSRFADEEHKNRSPLLSANDFDLQKSSATPSPSTPNSFAGKSSASSSAVPNNPSPPKPSFGSNPPTPLSPSFPAPSFPSPTMSYRRSGKKRRRRRSGVAAAHAARAASNASPSPSSFLSSLNGESNDKGGQNKGAIAAPPLQIPGSPLPSQSPIKSRKPPRSPTSDSLPRNSDSHSAAVNGARRPSAHTVRQSPLMSPTLKPAHSRSMSVSSYSNGSSGANATTAAASADTPRSLPPSSPTRTPTPLRRTPSFTRRRSRSRLISTASPTMTSGVAFVGRSRSGSRAASPPPNFPFAAIVAPLTRLRILRLKNCKVGGSLVYLLEGSVYPSMFKLNLSNCQLCDRDMSLLVNFPNLLWLHTKNSPDITSRGFAVLARLNKLQHLSLEGCVVDGACMEAFPPSLTYLDLNLTFPSSDPGVRILSRLKKLQYLSLLDCHLTDKFVTGVTRHLPDLYSLVLCRSHLTPHGLEDLRFLAQEHRFVVKLNQYDQRKHDWKVVESFGPHST